MARTRAAEHPRHSPKKISVEDIANGTARLQEVLTAINDFSQEGFPYRDAARSKAELQLRECVKQVFGERSQEFQDYRRCTLRTSTTAETAQSIAAVKRLLLILEEKKLELQGLKPAPAMPVSPGTGKVSPVTTAQMRLVPPASSTTMAPKPAQVIPAPSVSVTMTTSLPPGSGATTSPPIPLAPVPPIPPTSTQSLPKMPVQLTATGQHPKPQAPSPILAPMPPIPPTATQSLPKMPVQPATTGQFPRPQTPPPAMPEPVAMVPPTPSVVVAPSSVPAAPPVLAPQPALSPPPTVSIVREAIPAPTQQAAPEPTPHSPMTSTQPIAVKPAQPVPIAQPLSELDTLHLIRKVCLRLHAVARQLRLRTASRPTIEIADDHDLTDLLRALLRLEFDEVATDEWTPPYSGGTPKTTLLLNREQIAIVATKTRPGLTDKEIAERVLADSGFYSAHDKCTTLFCFVYDPEGRIGSPKRLETDLTKVSDRYRVEVLVAPK